MTSRLCCLALPVLVCAGCLVPNPHLVEDETDATSEDDGSTGESGETESGESSSGTETADETTDDDVGEGCSNGEQDGDETDIDCGGSCGPCEPGDGCVDADDCTSSVCEDEVCQSPTCSDGVVNGSEVDVDCGGNCRFCEHSEFVPDLAEASGGAFLFRQTVFEDGAFALLYVPNDDVAVRIRWFDEYGVPFGPGEAIVPAFSPGLSTFPVIQATGRGDYTTWSVWLGDESGGFDYDDLFLLGRAPGGSIVEEKLYDAGVPADFAEADADGSLAAFVWDVADEVVFRRRDLELGTWLGGYISVSGAPVIQPQGLPAVAVSGDRVALAWSACVETFDCDIFIRRFEGEWIDDAPVALGQHLGQPRNIKMAFDARGRLAVSWSDVHVDVHEAYAAIMDTELNFEGGGAWELPVDAALDTGPSVGVEALEDGSFVFAWTDAAAVHVRRFVDVDVPLVAGLEDEAPWGGVTLADGSSNLELRAAGRLVVVSWRDADHNVAGQVLGY